MEPREGLGRRNRLFLKVRNDDDDTDDEHICNMKNKEVLSCTKIHENAI